MPLSRYQIRNEYSLADPDLYRAADKDDPEALLEGVAMAGLVGVLRQLGDLAEFAAEIFHNLHEEVTATASRGHSLMVRVQQLEAEFPTIEKAFLSQTSHSSFYYSAGIDRHPIIRMDQNLITQGELPRFIMDFYEECRGPPRLFLLDKFDVAGAGACLKRYTDPSVFKVETSHSGISSADGLREKKTRKAKKKGSRWRNGETPEILPTSHAKLHQLFLEEHIENGTSDSTRRVKLKRKLNGFPFDNRSGKSYMEKFLKSLSADHEEVHEIPVDSSPLALPYNNTCESAFEIVEVSMVSPEKESKQTMRSPLSSPPIKETGLALGINEPNEVPSAKGIPGQSKSNSGLEANGISSNLHKGVTEKEILVGGGIKTEETVDDYQSDDVASEIDNYVDALTTMESDMDTDSELRSKNNLLCLNSRRQGSELDVNGEQVHVHFSDSLSMGNSSLSDDGNSSSKKDLSGFSYSGSHSTSAENIPSDGEVSSNVFTSTEIHEADNSSTHQSIGEEGQVSLSPEGAISDVVFTEPVEIPGHSFELGDPTACSTPSDSVALDKNEDAVLNEIALVGPETDKVVAKVNVDPLLISSIDVCRQEGDYLSPQMSGDNQHMDEFEDENINKTENLGCTSHLSVACLSKDVFPFQVSAENKFDSRLEDVDRNRLEDLASTSNFLAVSIAMDENPSLLSTETQPLNKLHDEVPNRRDDSASASNPSDALLQNRDDLSPRMSAENLRVSDSGIPVQDFLLATQVCASDAIDAATEKKITEDKLENITLTEDRYIDPMSAQLETHYSKVEPVDIDSEIDDAIPSAGEKDENVISKRDIPVICESETRYSEVEPVDRDSEIDDAIPSAGEIAENVIFKEDILIICESVESLVLGATADITPLGPSGERTSYLREDYFDGPSENRALMNDTASDPDLLEMDTTSEPSLMAGVRVYLDEVDYEPLNVPVAFAGHDDHGIENDDDGSSVDPKKYHEGPLPIVGDEHNGLETATHLLDRPGESDIIEDVCHQKFASSDLCNIVTGDDSVLQTHDDASDLCIVSEARSNLSPDDAQKWLSSVEQNHVEEKFNLQPQKREEKLKLLNGGEASSELFNQLQQTHYSDHDGQVGAFDASFEPLLVNMPSQPSASELLPQGNNIINVTDHLLNPSRSISSGFSLLSSSSQIYVKEMPPLPPLPPVQWRTGKLQHANQALDSPSAKYSPTAFPSTLPCSSNQEDQPLVPFFPPSISVYEMSTPVSEQPVCNDSPFLSQVPSMFHNGEPKNNVLPPEGIEWTNTPLQLPGSHGEMQQNDFQAGEGEKVQTILDDSHASAVDAVSSLELSQQEVVKPLNQMAPEKSLKDHELGHCSAHSDDNVMTCDTTELPSNVANAHAMQVVKPLNQMAPEKSLKDRELGQCSAHSDNNVMTCDTTELPSNVANAHTMPTSEEILSWPTAEDGKLHGVRKMKLPQPRNPLIDAVAAHDKSKLRKVTERVRPQIQKEDERDSLLEQIRTKSFNLKPAVVTRPSIQGPKTNINVVAILEKAKTIRQAFAGSDEEEEDDDSWSDS